MNQNNELHCQALTANCTIRRSELSFLVNDSKHMKKVQSFGAGTYVKNTYVVKKMGLAVKEELNRTVKRIMNNPSTLHIEIRNVC